MSRRRQLGLQQNTKNKQQQKERRVSTRNTIG